MPLPDCWPTRFASPESGLTCERFIAAIRNQQVFTTYTLQKLDRFLNEIAPDSVTKIYDALSQTAKDSKTFLLAKLLLSRNRFPTASQLVLLASAKGQLHTSYKAIFSYALSHIDDREAVLTALLEPQKNSDLTATLQKTDCHELLFLIQKEMGVGAFQALTTKHASLLAPLSFPLNGLKLYADNGVLLSDTPYDFILRHSIYNLTTADKTALLQHLLSLITAAYDKKPQLLFFHHCMLQTTTQLTELALPCNADNFFYHHFDQNNCLFY